MGFPGDSTVKNLPAMQETQETGSVPGSGRSPGGGHGNPLQYSCLETPMDRGAWWATVHGVARSQTRLKDLSVHACKYLYALVSIRLVSVGCVSEGNFLRDDESVVNSPPSLC